MSDIAERLTAALADRYAIERELGSGGMATVFLAQDRKHRRNVAIKVLKPELAAAIGAERFLREIEISARLHHPHILPLYDSGEADGFLYYVMPYVEGESLRERVRREKQLPLDEALEIAREVADALSSAHSHGVVHRDIKPENILLEEGHAVVADFGIARAVTAAGGQQLTETGVALGTPAYMSPEQAAGGKELDGRTDVYALGCVLYEMLAGEPPFTGPTVESIVHQHLTVAPPAITNLRQSVPASVSDALGRALAKAPADRFATASQFADALGEAAAAPQWIARPGGPLRVMGLYLLSAAAVLGLVQVVASQLALPRWVVPGAIVLLLIGFPIILGTALVQRGSLSVPRPARHLLTWRRAILGGVLAFAAWGVVVTAYMLTGGMRSDVAAPAGAEPAIAVLPFRAVGPDLDFWREGMVDLLSTNLEGVAGLRKVDPRTIVSHWRAVVGESREVGDATGALNVARRVGASYAVTGSVVGLQGAVRLTADVYDVSSGELRGTASVDGSPDSVLALVDALSLDVLRTGLVPADAELPRVDVSRATTRSLPALKAYLAGEQNYRRSRWEAAIEDFSRAVELDSTFALALYRLSLAYGWVSPGPVVRQYGERAARLADRLPEREALLLAGMGQYYEGRLEAIETLRTLVMRYPDDVEGWSQLGEAYLHIGGRGLHSAERFRTAFGRAIDLNPYFGPAYVHMIEDAFFRDDSAAVARLLEGFRRIDAETPVCGKFETGFALAWGDSGVRERAFNSLDELDASAFACLTQVLPLTSDQYGDIIETFRPLMATGDPRSDRYDAAHTVFLAATRTGRMRQARQAVEVVWEDPAQAAQRYLWLHLTSYPDTAGIRYVVQQLSAEPAASGAFWLGVLAVHEGRWEEVGRRAEALEAGALGAEAQGATVDRENQRALALALRGYAALRRGDRREGIRQIEDAMPRLPGWGMEQRYLRYAAALALLDLDGPRDALLYLESLNPYVRGQLTAAELLLGKAYEAVGETEAAKFHYARFVRLWEQADPELRPWWEEGRQALLRLTGEPREGS